MSRDDDPLRQLLRRIIRPGESKHRSSYDPASIDRQLADEQVARVTQRTKPRHAPPPKERPEPKRKRWSAKDAFSVAKAKNEERNRRRAAHGPYAPRGRTC